MANKNLTGTPEVRDYLLGRGRHHQEAGVALAFDARNLMYAVVIDDGKTPDIDPKKPGGHTCEYYTKYKLPTR